jgi:hypothetical protein
MHQAAIRSLGLIEDKLRKNLPEKKATHHKENRKEEFKRQSSGNETSESSGNEKHQKTKGGRKDYDPLNPEHEATGRVLWVNSTICMNIFLSTRGLRPSIRMK